MLSPASKLLQIWAKEMITVMKLARRVLLQCHAYSTDLVAIKYRCPAITGSLEYVCLEALMLARQFLSGSNDGGRFLHCFQRVSV